MSRFSWLEIKAQGKKFISQEPESYDAYFYLKRAKAKFLNGEFEPALRYYARSLEQDHLIEEAWVGQLRCLIELGEFSEAVVWADRAIQLFPGSARILAMKALALGRKGELDRALAASDASLKSASERDGLVFWARGDILISSNQNTAESCFLKAKEAGNDKLDVYLCIAKSYLSMGMDNSAKKTLIAIQSLGRDNPQFWYFLGICNDRMGELAQARNCWVRALELKPDYSEARHALNELERKGLYGKLVAMLKKFFSGG